MLLTDHVALTSLTSSVTTGSLMKVAAAIQKQVTRDLSPIWGIRGTVNAFELLTDVPTDYYQVVIFNDTDELLGRLESALGADQAAALVEGFDSQTIGGIHVNAWTRQPFALVQAVDDSWPALASHEILELLVDPYGNRLIAAAHALDASRRVEYLLEICDPCQQIWYTVNGVPVSDFYTPRYFDPVRNDCNRISFTGELTTRSRSSTGATSASSTRRTTGSISSAAARTSRASSPRSRPSQGRRPRCGRSWTATWTLRA